MIESGFSTLTGPPYRDRRGPGHDGHLLLRPALTWQRPTNETTNGLLRAYFPKSTDLSVHSADDIALVQLELNRRPRKVLGWDNPADRLATLLETPSVLRR